MKKDYYFQIYNASNDNAYRLWRSGEALLELSLYAPAYFLGTASLEEIAKGQFAADIITGLKTETQFKKFYNNHKSKIKSTEWVHDEQLETYNLKWIGPDEDDVLYIDPIKPSFKKRNKSLYVDVDFEWEEITEPANVISKEEAEGVLHMASVALTKIWETTEYYGHNIGTKGFMK